MKTIKKDELFRNLSDFLNTKGVELKDGAYAKRVNRACDLLTDAINGTQKTIKRAKVEVDNKLAQLRQTIHEATAPEPPPTASAPKPASPHAEKEKRRPRRKQSSAAKKARRKP
jgi:hypothetical protein